MIELILFAIVMATIIALLLSLLYMNWLIHALYDFGLRFSYEWAGPYYSTLRLGFALLSIMVIASLSMVILYRRLSKVKKPGIERELYPQTLMKRVQELRLELWKYKRKPSGVAGHILLLLGATAFVSSIIYESSILAFIGLGLTFWGVLFSFTRPVRYVKSSLLDSTVISTLTNIARVIADLGYRGKGIYLPPRYLKGLKEGTVFISCKKDSTIPTVEEISDENIFIKNPEGICLTASGLGLVNLFEEELGIDFAKVDLKYLQDNLPKLFVEGLEIAEDFEMKTQGNMVRVKMTETIYKDICSEIRKLPNICVSFGCPLCSSIACALARSSGEPVVIEKIKPSVDGKMIEVYYRIMGTIPSMISKEQTVVTLIEAPPAEAPPPPPKGVAPEEVSAEEVVIYISSTKLIGLVLAAIGTCTLIWIGWLTWYDITTWSKSLALIFFGSRTGEAISLGIGMKVIHYFLMGVALFLSGVSMLFQKRGE